VAEQAQQRVAISFLRRMVAETPAHAALLVVPSDALRYPQPWSDAAARERCASPRGSLSPTLSFSLSLCVCLSLPVSLSLSRSRSLHLSLPVALSLALSLSLSLSRSLSFSPCLSLPPSSGPLGLAGLLADCTAWCPASSGPPPSSGCPALEEVGGGGGGGGGGGATAAPPKGWFVQLETRLPQDTQMWFGEQRSPN
jgi:hypothetical protein